MWDCDVVGFFGVIVKVVLGEYFGIVVDDFNGFFVGVNGFIGI